MIHVHAAHGRSTSGAALGDSELKLLWLPFCMKSVESSAKRSSRESVFRVGPQSLRQVEGSMVDSRECQRCGQKMPGSASRENVLPRWLHAHVELPGVSLQHWAVYEEGITALEESCLNNFVSKSICTHGGSISTASNPSSLLQLSSRDRFRHLANLGL